MSPNRGDGHHMSNDEKRFLWAVVGTVAAVFLWICLMIAKAYWNGEL